MIRETIKEALLARNMTRKELARLAGCRINTITDYLNAKSEMRSDLLTKVFEIMKIKIGASDITRSDARKSVCDVCGSDDVIEAPHMGKNCNRCHPL